jgi:hypothetical protein
VTIPEAVYVQLRVDLLKMSRVMLETPVRPRTQHGYHHDTKIKPEAATAVVELLTKGGRTPETC